MRRVLLHHAEHRDAQKRAGERERVTLDEALATLEQSATVDLIDLNTRSIGSPRLTPGRRASWSSGSSAA
jgi:hypothetical protein